MTGLSRRQLLRTTGALTAGGLIGAGTTAADAAVVAFASNPFTTGVGSGDSTPTGVILWTRLAPDPVALDMGMAGRPDAISVHWRIATTAAGARGDATSLAHGDTDCLRRDGYSIHLDAGGLQPNHRYFYEFSVPRTGSTAPWRSAGTTRTSPADTADVEARFVVLSCQSFGLTTEFYFNGLRQLADRTTNLPQFAIYLGDYLYEFRGSWATGDDAQVLGQVADTLPRYRQRYAWYKRRASLQDLHRNHPVFGVMDDHEYWNDVNGFSTNEIRRFNSALQAYWENMPMRARPAGTLNADGSVNTTSKGSLRMHRRLRWGRHLDLIVGDGRQHRHADGSTMLGAAQREQLVAWVRGSSATWTAVAAGVPMSWFEGAGGVGWGGFEADRDALTTAFFNRSRWNNVVLAGDVHCGMVNAVRRRKTTASRFVATEFVTPPVSSGGDAKWADLIDNDSASDGTVTVGRHAYVDGAPLRGYLQCNVDATSWRSEFFLGDSVSNPGGSVSPRGVWKITSGRVGAHRI